jgi:hypothetical protein
MSLLRIVVIANCQALGLGRCLQLMAPDAEVLVTSPVRLPSLVTAARSVDVVVSQPAPAGDPTAFAQRRDRLVLVPRIVFSGFHPDMGFLLCDGRHLPSPTGAFHSRLTLWAYMRGLSVAQTVTLFDEKTFERLGYFDRWQQAWRELIAEGEATGMPLDAMLTRWRRHGCFMLGVVQPQLFVLADIAAAVLDALDRRPAFADVAPFLHDELKNETVWSVYPPLADRLGVPGDYAFKAPGQGPPRLFDLSEFIEASFHSYRDLHPEQMICPGLDLERFDRLLTETTGTASPGRHRTPTLQRDHPYRGLPLSRFWRQAIAGKAALEVDPVDRPPPFTLTPGDRIATAGSCFGQHLVRGLSEAGLTHHVVEADEGSMFPPYAARYGHIYTVRQLVQLFDRANGQFIPTEPAWRRADGSFEDPFRQSLAHVGWPSLATLMADRERHLAAVRRLFEEIDVFIFTLGLTEAWVSRADGAVFALAPGVLAGRHDPERHAFVNFTAAEVVADLEGFITRLRTVNPGARIVLTVSPVPLAATYEPHHVLVASTYGKAVLRAAAGEVERRHAHVAYFPAYELVAGPHVAAESFATDLRSVTAATVDRVVALFLRHFADAKTLRPIEQDPHFDFVCEEDVLDPGVSRG